MPLNLTDPSTLAALLQFQAYANRFSDFPPDFLPPALLDANYIPPTRAPGYLAILGVTLAIACIVVPVRLLLRVVQYKGRKWGWDDNLISVGFVSVETANHLTRQLSFVAYSGVAIASVSKGGVSKHVYDLDIAKLGVAQRLIFVSGELYIVSVLFLNLSVCFVVRRLYDGRSRLVKWLIWGTFAFFLITGLAAFFLLLFSSNPVAASWNLQLRLTSPGQKVDGAWVLIAIGIFYGVSDAWMLLLPAIVLWKLRVPVKSRLGVSFIFLVASFALAASIVRLFYIKGVYRSWDPTWNGIIALSWNQAELFSGMMALCLPGFAVLFPSMRRDNVDAGTDFSGSHTSGGSVDAKEMHYSTSDKL